MSTNSAEIDELITACRMQRGSSILLKALLAEGTSTTSSAKIASYIAEIPPEIFTDASLRALVVDFLQEAGQDELAAVWSAPPEQGEAADSEIVELFPQRQRRSFVRNAQGANVTKFADVAGLEEVKRQIHRRMIAPRERPQLLKKFGRRAGGGLLLYGPPGCGKTLLARATAGEIGASLFEVGIADVLDRFYGESEKRIVAAFAEAKKSRPSVLFFDEIEALAARRSGGQDSRSSLVSTFLNAFDGLQADADGVLVIGATNVPWSVDSAFRRPGRFDRTLFVPPPDVATRQSILGILLSNRKIATGLGIEAFAAATSGFSGADLLHLVETAADLAIEEGLAGAEPKGLSRRHFEDALKEVRPTTLEWLSTARNYAKYANDGGQYDDVMSFIARNGR